jgi:antitoxin MazE
MRVAKWGRDLTIRVLSSTIDALGLRGRDEVIERDRCREDALERIRALRRPLPLDWRFDRRDANAR